MKQNFIQWWIKIIFRGNAIIKNPFFKNVSKSAGTFVRKKHRTSIFKKVLSLSTCIGAKSFLFWGPRTMSWVFPLPPELTSASISHKIICQKDLSFLITILKNQLRIVAPYYLVMLHSCTEIIAFLKHFLLFFNMRISSRRYTL